MSKSFFIPPAPRRRGSAVVELAILLPVYVVLVLSLILIGYLGLAKIANVNASFSVAERKGVQPPDEIDREFYGNIQAEPLMGTKTLLTGAGDREYMSGEVYSFLVDETLEDLARDPVGYYYFNLQTMQLEYKVDVNRLSRFGAYIFRNRLQDESGTLEALMDPWLRRGDAEVGYTYKLGQDFLGGMPDAPLPPLRAQTIRRGELQRGHHPNNNPDFIPAALSFYGTTGLPKATDEGAPFWRPN